MASFCMPYLTVLAGLDTPLWIWRSWRIFPFTRAFQRLHCLQVVLPACLTIQKIGGPRNLVSVPDHRVLGITEGSAYVWWWNLYPISSVLDFLILITWITFFFTFFEVFSFFSSLESYKDIFMHWVYYVTFEILKYMFCSFGFSVPLFIIVNGQFFF